jgi:hypothetical protein
MFPRSQPADGAATACKKCKSPMSDPVTDADRLVKLKKLAARGRAGGPASYVNRLIERYSKTGHLTDSERKRIDQFLAVRLK